VSQISERERKELTDLKVSRDHLHPSAVVNVKAWFLFTFITELAKREKNKTKKLLFFENPSIAASIDTL
jgi:hypothetical protein